jgi:large subunit ribosomal protein L21
VRIAEILLDGAKPSKKAAAKPEAKPEAAAEEKPAKAKKAKAEAAPAGTLFAAPEGEGDDLTKIKGVGKVAAGQLKEQGLTTFAQLAALTDEDIARIDAAMPFSAEQIGDWREQAKTLA